MAIESAGIIPVRSDPRDVVAAIEFFTRAYRKMIQNLVWATAYNLVAIPVAGGLLVRWGIDLPMSVGAIAMSASTIIVAANAQLLRRLNWNARSSGWPSRLWHADSRSSIWRCGRKPRVDRLRTRQRDRVGVGRRLRSGG